MWDDVERCVGKLRWHLRAAEPQDNVTAWGGELLIKDVDIGTEIRGEVGRIELGALLPRLTIADSTMPTMSTQHAHASSCKIRERHPNLLKSFDLYQLRHLPLLLVLSPQPASCFLDLVYHNSPGVVCSHR